MRVPRIFDPHEVRTLPKYHKGRNRSGPPSVRPYAPYTWGTRGTIHNTSSSGIVPVHSLSILLIRYL